MKCEICEEEFSGIEVWKQHEVSEKHRINVLLHQNKVTSGLQQNLNRGFQMPIAQSSVLFCPVCIKSFYTLPDFQIHSISKEHAEMVLKQKQTIISDQEESICDSTVKIFQAATVKTCQYNEFKQLSKPVSTNNITPSVPLYSKCEPCNESFTDPKSFKEHIDGSAHKKKCGISILNETVVTEQKNLINQDSSLVCKVCNNSFNGPVPYQDHIKSIKHKKKVLAASNNSNITLNEVVLKNMKLSKIAIPEPLSDQYVELDGNQQASNKCSSSFLNKPIVIELEAATNSLFCEICDSIFSCMELYQQHKNNADHQRKALLSSNNSKMALNNISASAVGCYTCEVCDITCSGPQPFEQHLKSERHQKAMNLKAVLNDMKFDFNAKSLPFAYFCELCNVQCSGPDPYKQHLAGASHAKKLIRTNASSKKETINDFLSNEIKSFDLKSVVNPVVLPVEVNYNSSASENADKVFKDFGKELEEYNKTNNFDSFPVKFADLNFIVFNVDEAINFDKTVKKSIKVSELDKCDEGEDNDVDMYVCDEPEKNKLCM